MSVDKRANGKWLARWRESAGGVQKSKQFDRKVDAQRFLTTIENSKLVGTYVDPAKGKTTVEAYTATWLERMTPTWRNSTREVIERSVRHHILPTLGARQLGNIKRADVEAWARALPLGPGTVALVRQHLGQILEAAVDDGLLPRNPADKAKMPGLDAGRATPVELHVLDAITANSIGWMRVAVPLALGLGLRQGEATGLCLGQVDFLRRVVRVDRQLSTPAGGQPVFAPPKTRSSYRSIPLPGFVIEAINAHLAEVGGPGDDGLILHLPTGKPISRQRFNEAWRAARAKADAPTVRYHDVRHTFASTLLSEGVSVKAVADWLGHANPAITLKVYAHLMPTDVDRGRSVLEAAFTRSAEDRLRTGRA
jgi:integrase